MIPKQNLNPGVSPADYVDGMHTALIAGAVLAAAGAIAGALLIHNRTAAEMAAPANVAFDAD
jgi:hypothetical protein